MHMTSQIEDARAPRNSQISKKHFAIPLINFVTRALTLWRERYRVAENTRATRRATDERRSDDVFPVFFSFLLFRPSNPRFAPSSHECLLFCRHQNHDAVESMLNLRGPVHRASDETPEEEENERGEENIDNSPIPWAIDIVRANAVLPLLRIIQSVPRNVETFEPIEDDGQVNDETLKLADSALILLAELANVGQILLEGVGFEVIRDEETGSCAYVNVESGMRTNELPRLAMDTDEDWPLDVVCECVSLLAPSGVDEKRGEVLWQVKVVDFKLGEEDRQEEDLAVVDVALEEEEGGTEEDIRVATSPGL